MLISVTIACETTNSVGTFCVVTNAVVSRSIYIAFINISTFKGTVVFFLEIVSISAFDIGITIADTFFALVDVRVFKVIVSGIFITFTVISSITIATRCGFI